MRNNHTHEEYKKIIMSKDINGDLKFYKGTLIEKYSNPLLDILLKDRTTEKNITFATDDYILNFKAEDEIPSDFIKQEDSIKIRVLKPVEAQKSRTITKAEVFTPSWICNDMLNAVDESWFNRRNDLFNTKPTEDSHTWEATTNPIIFEGDKSWEDYVTSNRLEITCGEAPFLCSRYDTVTGEPIEISRRIGIIDRKLRIVGEHTTDKEMWLEWAIKAFKSTYGYDWQGDNVFIARVNLLNTFIEYYNRLFNEEPSIETLTMVAEILSWNIWQMDGLKCVIPNSCKNGVEVERESLFGEKETIMEVCKGCKQNKVKEHNGIYCYIMDWKENEKVRFVDLINDEERY